MKKIVGFLVLVLLMSCKQTITESDLNNLNGYWEIEKVILPNGEKKEYKVNETIDFFKIENKKGFRKNVMPQMDGTYLTNNIQETVTIELIEGTASIHYNTPYAHWKEEIIELSKDKLVTKNQQDLEYHYKRPVKFSIK
jgi:hypothetical protein